MTQTSVYRYYDDVDVLIYVGITSAGTSRNQQHNKDKEWWDLVCRQDVHHYADRDTALRREADLIRQFRPPFNVQHNPQHDEIRSAYLLLRRSLSIVKNPEVKSVKQMAMRSEKSMPLIASVAGDETWLMTVPEFSGIVENLSIAKGASVVNEHGNVIGKITKLDKIGPVARLVVKSSPCRDRGVLSALALLKFVSLKQPVNLGIQRVVISLGV